MTERVSIASDGTQGNAGSSAPSVSADGRYVAFASSASTLVPGDTNGRRDVFVRDRLTSQTVRVSVASDGTQANSDSQWAPGISADGRFVVFASGASNLVADDTNNSTDVFVHDMQTAQTTRVSIASGGQQANNSSIVPSISGDGRFVAFESGAGNLVAGDTNNNSDVFVHDCLTGQTELVSVASDGTQGNAASGYMDGSVSISADGRYVAFSSGASNLVPGGRGNVMDVYVHDRQTGQTTRDGSGGYASISANGRFVAFNSFSDDVVPGDTNSAPDVFVRDRLTGKTDRVSVASDGTQGTWTYGAVSLSADGRLVAFQSSSANLVTNDTNGFEDIFIHDRQTGQTTRASIAFNGTQGSQAARNASISSNGNVVAFDSDSSNLADGDTNGATDVFVRELPTQTTGSLQVIITPPAAVAAGAKWQLAGGDAWNDSGSIISLAVGDSYTVKFGDGLGWMAPVSQSVSITTDTLVTITGTYIGPFSYQVFFQTDGTPGSSITGDELQTILRSGDCSPVSAQVPADHRFIKWTRNGVDYSSDNPLAVTNVTEDTTMTAMIGAVYTASGHVVLSGQSDRSEVRITFSRVSGNGLVPPPVQTDSAGAWSQGGFDAGTVYRALPEKRGWTLSPACQDFSSASTTLDFTAATDDLQWVWTKGSSVAGQPGVYGTKGVASSVCTPGTRGGAVTWSDASGALWLFGGVGYADTPMGGELNDLWKYDTATGNWTWVTGASTTNQPGCYGTQGVPDFANTPGARSNAISWIDASGALWLFGGSDQWRGRKLNDLWKYDPTSGKWTWMKGASSYNQQGIYGTLGTADSANTPGARDAAVSWIDDSGTLWLFGGWGYDSTGSYATALNDLWKYDPVSGNWTWITGSSICSQPGVYGTRGVPDQANTPGARYGAVSWTDTSGALWLFSGTGAPDDLWKFDPAGRTWTWITGASTPNEPSVYGTRGVSAPANTPGSREGAVSWTSLSGKLCLYGGNGVADATLNPLPLDDLWEYDPATGNWTWVKGAGPFEKTASYGTQGRPDPANTPGSRINAASWADPSGVVWIFGGHSSDTMGSFLGPLNDLWRLGEAPFGSLQVTFTPPEAITSGSQWRLLGEPTWRDSGTELLLPVGNYTVEFKDIVGWITPAAQSISVAINALTNVTGAYQGPCPIVRFQTDNTPGASLSGAMEQTVQSGSNCQPVSATAPTGYHFKEWTLGGAPYSDNNPLTITGVSGDMTLTAVFAINQYTVTFQTDGTLGASLTGAATQVVAYGGNCSPVKAETPANYAMMRWTVSDVEYSTDNPIVVSNVTSDLQLVAEYGLLQKRYVDSQRPDNSGDGLTWETAKRTIQAAIDSSSGPEDVWVRSGTYPEALTMRTQVALYGGFLGNETDLAQRASTPLDTTITNPANHVVTMISVCRSRLDGFRITGGRATGAGARGPGIYCLNPGSGNVIANCYVFGNSATDTNYSTPTRLDVTALGGGIYCEGGQSLTIDNCRFNNNALSIDAYKPVGMSGFLNYRARGGGMAFVNAGAPRIIRSEICNNSLGSTARQIYDPYYTTIGTDSDGAGIYLQNTGAELLECRITNNTANSYDRSRGAGVYCDTASALLLRNCIVAHNQLATSGYTFSTPMFSFHRSGDCYGAGILAFNISAVTVTNCTIASNSNGFTSDSSNLHGGGIAFSNSALTLTNVLFSGHDDYAIAENNSAIPPVIRNCLFNSNQPGDYLYLGATTLTGKTAINALSGNSGNVDDDPRLLADCSLRYGSGAVDMGTQEGAPPTDIRGSARPVDIPGYGAEGTGHEFDIGAYEASSVSELPHQVVFQTNGLPGSTLSGATLQIVAHGGDCTSVAANAPEGCVFVKWTKDGGDYSVSNPLTITNVTADLTLMAMFADTETPVSSLIPPADTTLAGTPINFSFTASDVGAGLAYTELWAKVPGSTEFTPTGVLLFGTEGPVWYSPTAGSGLYQFASKAVDFGGNAEPDPVASMVSIYYNATVNGTFVQPVVPGPNTLVFPMRDDLDVTVTLTAASAGHVSVSRLTSISPPAYFHGNTGELLPEMLSISQQGLGTFTATIEWPFDPVGAPAVISNAWSFEGSALEHTYDVSRNGNVITISGVTDFSDWYAGNPVAVPVAVSSYSVE